MANELVIKNGLISKGTQNFLVENTATFNGTSTSIGNQINIDGQLIINANDSSSVDLSVAGSVTGVGLIIPTLIPNSPQLGSMYVDIGTLKLYIFDGSTWRYTSLT